MLIASTVTDRLAFCGDSTTCDPYTNVPGSTAIPTQLAALLAPFGIEVYSGSHSGWQYGAWTPAQIEARLGPFEPTVIIVQLGINDLAGGSPNPNLTTYGVSGGITEGLARQAILHADLHARFPQARIIQVTITPFGFGGDTFLIWQGMNQSNRTTLPTLAYSVLDLQRELDPNDTMLMPDDEDMHPDAPSDFAHPNQKGMDHWARWLMEYIPLRYELPDTAPTVGGTSEVTRVDWSDVVRGDTDSLPFEVVLDGSSDLEDVELRMTIRDVRRASGVRGVMSDVTLRNTAAGGGDDEIEIVDVAAGQVNVYLSQDTLAELEGDAHEIVPLYYDLEGTRGATRKTVARGRLLALVDVTV